MPTLLLGAPGTGKTYNLIQKILDAGTNNFAFVSFTRSAANEAKQRLRLYFLEQDLKYVRTIHSMCFNLLKLKQTQVIQFAHILKFAQEYGYELHNRLYSEEDGTNYGLSDDDVMYRDMLIDEVRMVDISEDTQLMKKRYDKYKVLNNMYDYNDMIHLMLSKLNLIPKFDLLCVDEIQDLTPLQLEFIKLLANNSKQVIYAGDENQMIFEWAGVDRIRYMKLKETCQIEELNKNYRLSLSVQYLAKKIISKPIGQIHMYNIEILSTLPLFGGGTWLILARNGYLLRPIVNELNNLGLRYKYLFDEGPDCKIKLSTIHGSKGYEADNVLILTDVSPATYQDILSDKEKRVWYVGITRTKNRLCIMEPRTEYYYDLL